MSVKYPYSGHTANEGRAFNYTNLTRAYQHFPTEKQLKYIDALVATCEKVGIDLEGFVIRRKTKNDARGSIRALITLLTKNGYDTRGNKIVTYNIHDQEASHEEV